MRVYLALRRLLSYLGLGFLLYPSKRDYDEDGLVSSRLRSFENDALFQKAIRKTVADIGDDYGIRWRTHVFLWCLNSAKKLGGDAVELGTGNGWMFTLAKHYGVLDSFNNVYLVDRFEKNKVNALTGEPELSTSDRYYTDGVEKLQIRFSNLSNVNIVQGNVPEILSTIANGKTISFIHIDLNAAVPTIEAIDFLLPYAKSGAIILLDDYGQPEFKETHDMVNDLAKKQGLNVLSLPTGQGLILVS